MTTKRKSHPNKHIEKAIQYVEGHDWIVKGSKGHPWGLKTTLVMVVQVHGV